MTFAIIYIYIYASCITEQSLRGIYLPVCREPRACHRRCLLLLHTTRAASAGGHFTAIVGPPSGGGTDSSSSSSGGGGIPKRSLVPLCDRSGRLLPLKYAFFDEKQGMKLMEDEGMVFKCAISIL